MEGDLDKTVRVPTDKCRPSVEFVVIAKDKHGRPLARGGDCVRASVTCLSTRIVEESKVTDCRNGHYVIRCSPPKAGKYQVNVYINGTKLAVLPSITCTDNNQPTRSVHHKITFNKLKCQPGISIASNKRSLRHSEGRIGWSSVLCTPGFDRARLTWSIRIDASREMQVFVGVAENRQLTARGYNYKKAFCWHCIDGSKWVLGVTSCDGGIGKFRNGDVISLALDCDNRTLTATNCTLGRTDRICNLPRVTLFPYVTTGSPGDCLSLL